MKKLVSLLLALAMLLSCTAALADIGTPDAPVKVTMLLKDMPADDPAGQAFCKALNEKYGRTGHVRGLLLCRCSRRQVRGSNAVGRHQRSAERGHPVLPGQHRHHRRRAGLPGGHEALRGRLPVPEEHHGPPTTPPVWRIIPTCWRLPPSPCSPPSSARTGWLSWTPTKLVRWPNPPWTTIWPSSRN